MTESVEKMFDLSGQVAIVTGAGRGIGLAMAQALAKAGCAIALQDLDLAVAEKEVEAINQSGGRALAFGGDISDLTLPARMVSEVLGHFGQLDILINNASIQHEKPWLKVTPAEMQTEFAADLISPILFIQQVWPIFQKQKSGRIINIGSIQQRAATLNMLPYSISKGALEKITLGFSREMAKSNVTINQIAPGWINTYRNRDRLTSPQVVAEMGKKHVPIGRLGEPEDFRGIILLLCSRAGSYITGQIIYVDGAIK